MYPSFEIFNIVFQTFPLILFTAFLFCFFVIFCEKRVSVEEKVNILYSLSFMAIFSVIGGKLFSIISLPKINGENILDLIMRSGSVFYGGLIGGFLGLFFYCKRKNLNYYRYSDLITYVLPLGQSIGRLGCFCNGCCYGKEYDGLFSIKYQIEGQIVSIFPTWFFESAFCLILFIFQIFLFSKNKIGICSSSYFILYAIFRFIIEYFRGDKIRGHLGLLSTSQIISIFVLLYGLFIIIKIFKMGEKDHGNL